MDSSKPTFIDLFCGCGGLSTGLEQAGLKCLLGIDIDKDATETFKLNHKSAKVHCGDIKTLSNHDISNLTENKVIDFIVGGPPCQGFSTIGRGDINDPRNFLFLEFARIVNHLKPTGFVFENVPGMLAPKNKMLRQQIWKTFEDMGYTLACQKLSVADYGVAQMRKRAIIVGIKKECNIAYSFPIPTHGPLTNMQPLVVEQVLNDIHPLATLNDPKIAEIKNEITRERLACIPTGCGIRYRDDDFKYLPKYLSLNLKWDELPEKRLREVKYQRLPLDRPSFTIVTSRSTYYHPTENRHLTPRETAAIQSFPDDFEFHGEITSIHKQIGNAVPVKLGEVLGKSLLENLNPNTFQLPA